MAGFASAAELRMQLTPATFLEIFDDDNLGTVADNAPEVVLVLALAHAQVISYLLAIYTTPAAELPATVSFLLKAAELDYAVAYSYERHPEYVRTFGEDKRAARWKRAEAQMLRIQASVQRIAPTDTPPEPKPANVGGIVYASGPRMIIDGPDGTFNGGDL